MIWLQAGHLTHSPSGTRLSLFAGSMGFRTFLNHAMRGILRQLHRSGERLRPKRGAKMLGARGSGLGARGSGLRARELGMGIVSFTKSCRRDFEIQVYFR